MTKEEYLLLVGPFGRLNQNHLGARNARESVCARILSGRGLSWATKKRRSLVGSFQRGSEGRRYGLWNDGERAPEKR